MPAGAGKDECSEPLRPQCRQGLAQGTLTSPATLFVPPSRLAVPALRYGQAVRPGPPNRPPWLAPPSWHGNCISRGKARSVRRRTLTGAAIHCACPEQAKMNQDAPFSSPCTHRPQFSADSGKRPSRRKANPAHPCGGKTFPAPRTVHRPAWRDARPDVARPVTRARPSACTPLPRCTGPLRRQGAPAWMITASGLRARDAHGVSRLLAA